MITFVHSTYFHPLMLHQSLLFDISFLIPTSLSGTSSSVELGEERPPFLGPNTVPTGPAAIFSGKFPSCCDLPLEYDPSPLYTRQAHETRVYPPIFRPTPRFFTPLCVSSNNFDYIRGEPLCAFPQSVECPLIKETDAGKLDENKTCIWQLTVELPDVLVWEKLRNAWGIPGVKTHGLTCLW